MKARVLVNGKTVEVTLRRNPDGCAFEFNGTAGHAVIAHAENNVYHVLLEGRSFEVRVSGDRMDINGHELHVELKDPRDAPSLGAGAGTSGRQAISAPMPGKVVCVLVAEGDAVERDQGVVVIEAMKMQNELKSPKAGHVTSLSAKQGKTVVSGEILAVVD